MTWMITRLSHGQNETTKKGPHFYAILEGGHRPPVTVGEQIGAEGGAAVGGRGDVRAAGTLPRLRSPGCDAPQSSDACALGAERPRPVVAAKLPKDAARAESEGPATSQGAASQGGPLGWGPRLGGGRSGGSSHAAVLHTLHPTPMPGRQRRCGCHLRSPRPGPRAWTARCGRPPAQVRKQD